MSESELAMDMEELSSAEEFLEYFEIPFEPSIVQVNRLHILQRFHDYLEKLPRIEDEAEQRETYRYWLAKAYTDFVESDALTEKVFKVFRMHEPPNVQIPLNSLDPKAVSGAPQV